MADLIQPLAELFLRGPVCVLTGAGCSTESGIPDYRGPETRRRARNPIRFAQFVQQPAGRQRYWARSAIGWRRIAAAQPNPAHRALAALERAGHLSGLITQNVDRLHHLAGSRDVVELHGALAEVVCLSCRQVTRRTALQERLEVLNPGWGLRAQGIQDGDLAPDGDVDLEDTAGFNVADCAVCGGPLKPHVVFFGESVPRPRVERGYQMVDEASALVVVGSSLAVFSGYRFCLRARDRGIPIVIVNLGETRGDPLAAFTIDQKAGAVLPALAARLGA